MRQMREGILRRQEKAMGETRQEAQHEQATVKPMIKNMQTKYFANRNDVGPKDSVVTWGFRSAPLHVEQAELGLTGMRTCSRPGMMSTRSCSKDSLVILSTTFVCILMAARLMG